MDTPDVTPSLEEIAQVEEEFTLQPIPTYVCGPVETRELPAKQGGYTSHMDIGMNGTQALPYEPRRKRALILCTDVTWIGASQQSVIAGGLSAFLAPAGLPITVDHMGEVWVAPVAGTTDVSVMTSYWSE